MYSHQYYTLNIQRDNFDLKDNLIFVDNCKFCCWLVWDPPLFFNYIFESHFSYWACNNVKLRYSCVPSMKNVIQKHYSKIMEDPIPTNNKTCICRQKSDCPLNQNCLSECSVHNAVVNISATKNYYGTCEKSFKE